MSKEFLGEVGVKGFYRLVVSKDKEAKEVVKDTGWFSNLIVDKGMDTLAVVATNPLLNYSMRKIIEVGSDNTPPQNTDLSMGSVIARLDWINERASYSNVNNEYIKYVYTKQFDKGVAAGNIAEVGFGEAEWNGTIYVMGNLFSRSLVVDDLGNPTTITVLSDEYLTVEYEVRMYIPQTDFTKTMDFIVEGSPVSTSLTIRPDNITTTSAWGNTTTDFRDAAIGNLTMGSMLVSDQFNAQYEGYSSEGLFSVSINPYTAGDFKVTADIVFDPSQGNIGEINFFLWEAMCMNRWKMNFSPSLIKDETKELTFTVGASWTRV